MNTAQVTAVFVAVFSIAMLYMGIRGAAATKTLEQFAVFRGVSRPFGLGFSYAATTVSTVVFVGIPGWAYAGGVSGLWFAFLIWPGFLGSVFLSSFLLRKQGQRLGALSVPDWLGRRYDSTWVTLLFGLMLLLNLFYLAGQFIGMATLLVGLMQLEYLAALAIVVFVTLFYVGLGGTHAQVKTDEIQAVFMALGALMIFFAGFFAVRGGVFALPQTLATQDPVLGELFNPKFPLTANIIAILAVAIGGLGWSVQPQLGKLFMALDKGRDVRIFIFSTALCFFFFYYVIWGGVYARVLYPGLRTPDAAIPTFINGVLPPVVAAFVGIAIFAAALSTLDTILVSLGTAVGNDIYRRILVAKGWLKGTEAAIDRNALWIARIGGTVIGLGALFMSLTPPPFLATFTSIGVFGLISGFFGPVILGLYWRRGTKVGAIAALIVGVVAFMAQTVWFPQTYGIWVALVICMAMSCIIHYLVSLASQGAAPPKDIVARAFGEAVAA